MFVNYTVIYDWEVMSLSDMMTAYEVLSTELMSSVKNGNFSTTLQSFSAAYSVPTLATVQAPEIQVGEPQVVLPRALLPSSPTAMPTAPAVVEISNILTSGEIGIMVVLAVLSCLIGAEFCFWRRRKMKMNSYMNTHRREDMRGYGNRRGRSRKTKTSSGKEGKEGKEEDEKSMYTIEMTDIYHKKGSTLGVMEDSLHSLTVQTELTAHRNSLHSSATGRMSMAASIDSGKRSTSHKNTKDATQGSSKASFKAPNKQNRTEAKLERSTTAASRASIFNWGTSGTQSERLKRGRGGGGGGGGGGGALRSPSQRASVFSYLSFIKNATKGSGSSANARPVPADRPAPPRPPPPASYNNPLVHSRHTSVRQGSVSVQTRVQMLELLQLQRSRPGNKPLADAPSLPSLPRPLPPRRQERERKKRIDKE